jgi:elongation factor P
MIKAADLKKTSVIEMDGVPHTVENIQLSTPTARGGNTIYRVRFRNVATKAKVDKSFKGPDALQEASFDTTQVQYLYKEGDRYTFMDLESYEQFELFKEDVEDALPFLIEDMEGITALMSGDKVLGIRMPATMEMKIEECPPSMKGASATSRTKPATLTTGLIVQVPEYIAPGDVIKVDTEEKRYLSRA